MKKIAGILLGTALLCSASGAITTLYNAQANGGTIAQTNGCSSVSNTAESLQVKAKSAYLMDYATQTPIYTHNECTRLPIASMCKIMTLLLSFEAIERGELTMDEEIQISESAASMGGSQVFLETNARYPVRELLKSIVVCSANDSCVAMAERVAGSESVFIERMNARAKELGATDTLFANCTGLPKQPQYSCAKDVALMLRALLKYPDYFQFSKVWLDKFAHPKGRYTEITNTNKLVRFYDGCDGGKTGFTNEAGFCLAATAKRGNLRVISVVIGEESSANRFEDVRATFDYAFANYSMTPIVEGGVSIEQTVDVQGGKTQALAVYPERSAYSFTKKGEKPNLSIQIQLEKVKAPVEKGEKVGELLVFKDGIEKDRIPLLAQDNVAKASIIDHFKKIAEGWNKRK